MNSGGLGHLCVSAGEVRGGKEQKKVERTGALGLIARGVPGAPHPWTREAHPRTMSSPYLMGSSPGCASSPGEERTQEP